MNPNDINKIPTEIIQTPIDDTEFLVIVAGGRTFNNYKLLKAKLDNLLSQKTNVTIVSGTAKGADTLGELYAKENNLGLVQMPANWEVHGKSAGYIRNTEMAKIAHAAVIFWDGQSKGSKHMIAIATSTGIPTKIIRY